MASMINLLCFLYTKILNILLPTKKIKREKCTPLQTAVSLLGKAIQISKDNSNFQAQ